MDWPISRRCDVPGVYGQEFRMLRGPFGRKPIERALRVVLLVGNHSSDADDQVIQTFRGRPEVADAHTTLVKIWMEHGRHHPALRSAPGVAQRKIHFQLMGVALLDFTCLRDVQPFDLKRDSVDFRRHPCRAANLDQRPVRKPLNQRVVVKFQAPDTW